MNSLFTIFSNLWWLCTSIDAPLKHPWRPSLHRINNGLCKIKRMANLNLPYAQELVRNMPQAMWTEEEQEKTNAVIGGRKGNSDKYKPGVKAIILVSAVACASVPRLHEPCAATGFFAFPHHCSFSFLNLGISDVFRPLHRAHISLPILPLLQICHRASLESGAVDHQRRLCMGALIRRG